MKYNYNMQAHEYAKLLVAELQLAILAEIGHELTMDKVKKIAQSTATLAMDKKIASHNETIKGGLYYYYEKVKECIYEN